MGKRKIYFGLGGLAVFVALFCVCLPKRAKWKTPLELAAVPEKYEHLDAFIVRKEVSVFHNQAVAYMHGRRTIRAGRFKVKIYKRVRILKPGGSDKASISLFVGRNETWPKIKARTITADGRTIEVRKDEIKIQDLVEDHISRKIVTFPQAGAGTEIEYEIEFSNKRNRFLAHTWVQEGIPIRELKVTYVAIPDVGLGFIVPDMIHSAELDAASIADNSKNVYTFTMKDVPARKEEPFSGRYDKMGLDFIHFVTSVKFPNWRRGFDLKSMYRKTWKYYERNKISLEKGVKQKALQLTNGLTDYYQKIDTIDAYIRSNIKTDPSYVVKAGRISEIMEVGRSSPRGKRILLQSMLHHSGILNATATVYFGEQQKSLHRSRFFIDRKDFSDDGNQVVTKAKQDFAEQMLEFFSNHAVAYGVFVLDSLEGFPASFGPQSKWSDSLRHRPRLLLPTPPGYRRGGYPRAFGKAMAISAQAVPERGNDYREVRYRRDEWALKAPALEESKWLLSSPGGDTLVGAVISEILITANRYRYHRRYAGDLASTVAERVFGAGSDEHQELSVMADSVCHGSDSASVKRLTKEEGFDASKGFEFEFEGKMTGHAILQGKDAIYKIGKAFLNDLVVSSDFTERRNDFYFSAPSIQRYKIEFENSKALRFDPGLYQFRNSIGAIHVAKSGNEIMVEASLFKGRSGIGEKEAVAEFFGAIRKLSEATVVAD